jgi:hypothetical protein
MSGGILTGSLAHGLLQVTGNQREQSSFLLKANRTAPPAGFFLSFASGFIPWK